MFPDADLRALAARCMQLLLPYLDGYIWQRDRFTLHASTSAPPPWMKPKSKGGSSASLAPEPPCLWGLVRFGDNIEDEWFIVWLLMELTRLMSDISVRVWDDDGEFLLIEAAYVIPRWLKPENAANRVWFRAGQLQVVPLPSPKHPTIPPFPTLQETLQILQSGHIKTYHSRIEQPIMQRLAGYPGIANQQMHRARVQVPARVAHVLKHEPQLVSAAVEAFYYRDTSDMRLAARMQHFPRQDMTSAVLSMNRCMYAQLMQQQFVAPKGYPVPAAGSSHVKAADLGLKITTGLEIVAALGQQHMHVPSDAHAAQQPTAQHVASSSSNDGPTHHVKSNKQVDAAPASRFMTNGPMDSGSSRQQFSLQSLDANPAWQAYQSSLERSGYYQGNILGSAKYKELLAAAQHAFISTDLYSKATAVLSAPAARITDLLAVYDSSHGQQTDGAIGSGNRMDGGSAAAQERALPSQHRHSSPAEKRLRQGSVSSQQQQQHGADAHSQQQQRQQPPQQQQQPSSSEESEDDDSWLEVQSKTLEQQLAQREAEMTAYEDKKKQSKNSRKTPTPAPPAAAAAAAGSTTEAMAQEENVMQVDAADLADQFKGFLNFLSSFEGAEVSNGEGKGGGSSATAASATAGADKDDEAGVSFNPASFVAELAGVLGVDAEDTDMTDLLSSVAGLSYSQRHQQQLNQQRHHHAKGNGPNQSDLGKATALGSKPEHTATAAAPAAADTASGGHGASWGSDDEYESSSSEGSSFFGDSDSSSDEHESESEGSLMEVEGGGLASVVAVAAPATAGAAMTSAHVATHTAASRRPPAASSQATSTAGATDTTKATGSTTQQQQLSPAATTTAVPKRQTASAATQPKAAASQSGAAVAGATVKGIPSALAWLSELWDIQHATDSDDESGFSHDGRADKDDALSLGGDDTEFMEAYDQILQSELAGTKMAESFERGGPGSHATTAAAPAGATAEGADLDDEGLTMLQPVNVDMNLVKNLIESYTSQGSLPGPASNIAGLLGLQLPNQQ
eukprot:jgi/Chrzof1/4222/Cz14g03190.t1